MLLVVLLSVIVDFYINFLYMFFVNHENLRYLREVSHVTTVAEIGCVNPNRLFCAGVMWCRPGDRVGSIVE